VCFQGDNNGGGFHLPFNLQATNGGAGQQQQQPQQQPSSPANALASLASNLNFLQSSSGAPAPAAAVRHALRAATPCCSSSAWGIPMRPTCPSSLLNVRGGLSRREQLLLGVAWPLAWE
jgi:hypothetical protein